MIGVATNSAQQDLVSPEVETVEFHWAIPCHKGIILISQPEGSCELVSNPIAVSEEPTELPFFGSSLEKLNTFAQPTIYVSARQSQQKLRPRVELGRSRSPIQCCRTTIKIKFASRPGTQLWLPMIQVVVDDIGTGADLMLAVGPA